MWQKVETFKGAEYFRKALYVYMYMYMGSIGDIQYNPKTALPA